MNIGIGDEIIIPMITYIFATTTTNVIDTSDNSII